MQKKADVEEDQAEDIAIGRVKGCQMLGRALHAGSAWWPDVEVNNASIVWEVHMEP
jgi:hypothetical protein